MTDTNAKTIDAIKRFQSAISKFENKDDRYATKPSNFCVIMSSETFRLIAGKEADNLLKRDGQIVAVGEKEEYTVQCVFHTSKGTAVTIINDGMGDLIEVL